MQPYLIKEIKNIIGHTFRTENPRILKQALKPETAQEIKELMVAAVDSGDSRQAKTEKVTLAGRTATVTIENESVGWFIGFAPAENPSIAFAIVVEKGTAYTAALVARRIVEFLF
jgi:peptidoglycan glycosyltransferase